jgi:hypothetical protein
MRALTALFDQQQDAEDARQQLIDAGLAEGDIQITRADDLFPTGRHEQKSFMQRVKDFFLPEEDRHADSEGVRPGSALLTVWARKGQEDRALQILRGMRAAPRLGTRRHRSRGQATAPR